MLVCIDTAKFREKGKEASVYFDLELRTGSLYRTRASDSRNSSRRCVAGVVRTQAVAHRKEERW